MDDQWTQNREEQPEEPQAEEIKPEAEEANSQTEETPAPAEPESPAEPEVPSYGAPPQWQGGYTYQNRNPYQYYQIPPYQPQKKSGGAGKGLLIAASCAAAVLVICCMAVVMAVFVKRVDSMRTAEPGTSQQEPGERPAPELPGGAEEGKEQENAAKRDESAVYNAPEVNAAPKTGTELSLSEIYKKVKNSVVCIQTVEQGAEEPEFSGSGFLISADGYILTNEHVVNSAARVNVILSDGITEYNAVVVGSDAQADIAVLKIEATGLTPVELGDSDQLEVGETVAAIGTPYGMELLTTMHNGIVSALNRRIEISGVYMTLIQTNALINPGNSGGPLVNAYGQVVGITSSKVVANGYEGISFAIPINDVTALVEELVNYGYVKDRAYIGIQCTDLSESYASYHNLPKGAYVVYVDPESDAAKQGLQKEDIIIAYNGKEIQSMADLIEIKNANKPGDRVTIKVWRNGKEREFTVLLTGAKS